MSSIEMSVARIVGVAADGAHRFSKRPCASIMLVAGVGVVGDAHAGVRGWHRSRVARDPMQPNLRQVHLIHAELLDELGAAGFAVGPGDLGENIVTRGVALLDLATDTRLRIGAVVLRVTGLRNPCAQIEAFMPGLLQAVLGRDADGRLVRRAGVMAVVEAGGAVHAGMAVTVDPPDGARVPLAVV